MPFPRPTLQELRDRAIAQFDTRVVGGDSRLRRSFLSAIALVHAGALYAAYGYLEWIAAQVTPDTADAEELDRRASLHGVTRKPATHAAFDVQVTGDDVLVPQGTVFLRSDSAEFTSDAEVTLSGGTADVPVTATVAGEAGTTAEGTALALASPINGLNSEGTVQAGGTVGSDAESDELLRGRLLQKMRQPPMGGAESDYVRWALEVAGVTRAWAIPQHFGDGTVGVTFVMDEKAGTIIPSAAEVQAVQGYIDAPYRRPVTADVTVFAPTPISRDVQISGLDPATTAVQDAIAAELADLVFREGAPGATVLLSHIRQAISIAAGENDHILDDPTTNWAHAAGEIPVLGNVVFV